MGALTRAYPWAATPLGPPETWPQSLRTAVRILLNTNHPMFIWWGPQLIQFYNDAYRQTMGPERHPSALGQGGRECWAEIWHIIGPQIEQVMSGGGATWHENQLVPVTRHGRLEQVYWTYGYSPIDEDDGIGGVLVVCRDVTRDYLASVALRERESELARVQQIGRIGGLEVDLTTGFRNRRSPEYLLIHGLPPDAADESHEDWVRRIHPEDREATEKKFRDAVAGTVREYTAQYRIIRPSDGEMRWILVKSTIERDENGNAIRLVGAHSDVTEQVEAEQALRQSEEEFRTLAEAVPHHVWTARPDGSLNWFNPRVYEYAGSGPGELDGEKWGKIVHPDDVPAAVAAWSHAIRTGEAYEVEFRLRRADGAFRWFLARAVPARDAQGRYCPLDRHQYRCARPEADRRRTRRTECDAGAARRGKDPGARPDLERVAGPSGGRRSQRRLADGQSGLDPNAGLERSRIAEPHLGMAGASRRWRTDPGGGQQALIQRNPTVRFESRFRHKDGSYRWLSWTGVPDQDHIYAVARDVTAEKAAAERLKATEEALLQSQKMEAVGQLTGGIAHDFNNLLTGIVGSLDLLQTRLNQGRTENVARYIDAAMTSANRAAALTHRLLAFARRQPLIPKSVDANQLVVSLEDLLRRTIGETIDLQIVAPDDLWGTLCDPNQLESALLNLAINARDAMPDGGKLTIATANARLDGVDRGYPGAGARRLYLIAVTDTGTGMSAEVAARAFDPFFTTKPIGQGTGLGLSMIYGFARQSDGHATIDSKLGQGTTVRLYLPRHHGDAATEHASAGKAAEHAATGETVLVVEDEPVVRAVILEMLGELGYRTLEAVDGPSGLRILRDRCADRSAGHRCRPARPERPPACRSGAGTPARSEDSVHHRLRRKRRDRRRLPQPGMEMITKPFDLENLSQRIRSMVSG